MDKLTPQARSEFMARIRSKDTKPEMVVRRMLHSLGYRYVLHDKRLPGRPDLVFPSRKKVVFVHGCFWHGHSCSLASKPKTNSTYWSAKIGGNKRRDEMNADALHRAGWSALDVWECWTMEKDLHPLQARLIAFLGPARSHQAS